MPVFFPNGRIIGKRRKVFALVVGSDFRHLLFFGGCDYNLPIDFAR